MAKTSNIKWDVPIEEKITYFDPTLSYEITKYRPIDEERGLDFDPSWFTEARDYKLETGKYCDSPKNSRLYRQYWDEQYRRCNEGYEVNGYRLTGDHYFFLNFYILKGTKTDKSGGGRKDQYPQFFSKQYEYFHYIDICEHKTVGKDVIALKSRGVGFSEIAASLGVRPYTTIKGYVVLYTAAKSNFLDTLLRKCWTQLDNLNDNTEDGMRKTRQVKNNIRHKRASILNRAGEERGWMSDISGIVADKPENVRGDRVDRLFFEEAGSDRVLETKYIQCEPLVELLGDKIGTRFVWGTGGDTGPALEALSKMFYNPEGYNGLPYKHNYTDSGEYVYTGFFIPAFTFVSREGFIDNRGVTNTKKAKEYYISKRNSLINDPNAYLKTCAERCFTPEEALSLEGDNIFNNEILSNQKAQILLHKTAPKIEIGNLEYKFKNNMQTKEAIDEVRFTPNNKGKIMIFEHPITNDEGNVIENLYVAGIDGIDIGQEDTSSATKDPSDFCLVVKRRQHGLKEPTIVCIYKDRPERLVEAHRTALKILQYYKCKAVLEHTRVSLLQFFRTRKIENKYLMRRPAVCMANPNARHKNIPFGAQINEKIIDHYLGLIAETIEQYGHNLWFIDLIEEALKYSKEKKTKFDIIAAWGMAELGDEEMIGVKVKDSDKEIKTWNVGYYIDENGYKRFGSIPNQNKFVAATTSPNDRGYDDFNRIRSTRDPDYM